MKFDVLTLFPEMFETLNSSIIKRAKEKNLIEINLINIRDFSKDKHKHVDDTPYGGGAGMLIMPDVVYDAYSSVKSKDAKVIYLSPKGKLLNQNKVKELAKSEHLILLCGHYEGIDVLTGGELPAMVLIDSVSRYVDGVLSEDSTVEESFSESNENLLEYPAYTRPLEFRGKTVPEVLTSGNHKEIEKWRKEQSLITTYKKRPELLTKEQKEEAIKLINNK